MQIGVAPSCHLRFTISTPPLMWAPQTRITQTWLAVISCHNTKQPTTGTSNSFIKQPVDSWTTSSTKGWWPRKSQSPLQALLSYPSRGECSGRTCVFLEMNNVNAWLKCRGISSSSISWQSIWPFSVIISSNCGQHRPKNWCRLAMEVLRNWWHIWNSATESFK